MARSNVTEIKVQSKRIHIPLQNQITLRSPEDEKGLLDKMLRQLRHYSGPSRTTALDELKHLVNSSPNAEAYISIIFPASMELLFDEERDTRNALVSLLSAMLLRFQSSSFVSITSIAVTYVCSGLTSLGKVTCCF